MSGSVRSSDAEQLWTESRSIREWSADRIAQLTGIISSLETRVNAVEERNKSLIDEKHELLEVIEGLREDLQTCHGSVEALTEKLTSSEARVEHLEEKAKESP